MGSDASGYIFTSYKIKRTAGMCTEEVSLTNFLRIPC
jgi:hypothetical protein